MAQDIVSARNFDYSHLQQILAAAKTDKELFEAIVDSPFHFKLPVNLLFLGIIVFLQVNMKRGTIDRIALSKTELAKYTTDISLKKFENIRIPINHSQNIIAQAIQTGEPQNTTDWKYLFTPALTEKQARLNQAGGAIAYSVVYPLIARDGGAMIFSYYQYKSEIGKTQLEFMKLYSKIVDKRLSYK